ncbi:hypothetical protein [Serratia marcescens]|uniref:hypothetical protein n=1 Tax=Serratia marcescens TaxID=615 RepID=UPI001BD4A1E4|nr:hypothetical protein [Serratia marcescens]
MEKLSELSKPVAWIIGEESIEEFKRGYETFVVRGDDVDSTEETMKLYSQEYVSALIQRAERLDSMLTESVQALKAAEQRVAELELRLAVEIEPPPVIYPGRYDCHAMHSAIRRAGFRVSGDSEHVGDVDMRDERALAAVSDKQRIAELEARLATPVRLPLLYSPDPWMSPDPDGTWLDKEDVKKSIRTAGFTVEGA